MERLKHLIYSPRISSDADRILHLVSSAIGRKVDHPDIYHGRLTEDEVTAALKRLGPYLDGVRRERARLVHRILIP